MAGSVSTVHPQPATRRARLAGRLSAPIVGAIAALAVGAAWTVSEALLPQPAAAGGFDIGEAVELAIVGLLGLSVALVAWRGRHAHEVTLRSLQESEWRFQQLLGGIALGATVLDTEGRLVFANGCFLRMTGRSREEVVGEDWASMFSPPDFPRERWQEILASLAAGTHEEHVPGRIRCADGSIRDVLWTNATLRDPEGRPLGMVGLCEDVTERRRADVDRLRLAAAVEQASDAILIADDAGRVVYANPSSEGVLGLPQSTLVGRAALDLFRADPRLDLETVADTLRRAKTWKGAVERRDGPGRSQHLDVVVSALRDGQGALTNYVGVARDVTRERAVEARLGREAIFRRRLATTIARLGPRDTPEETAAAICAEIVGLEGFAGAAIFAFPGEDDALVLGNSGEPRLPVSPGRRLPPARAAYLRERAANGAWIEPWRVRSEDGAYGTEIAANGPTVMAYAPISNGLGPLGVLAVATPEADAALLPERLPAVAELAVAASSLLGSTLHRWRETADLRIELAEIIATRAFHPVFQPVVELRSEHIVGYEALCRFPDGASPVRRFSEAQRVGLAPDLELAAIERALVETHSLPGDVWVSVNVSPGILVEYRDRLAAAVGSRRHRLVLEVTENEPVADYDRLRTCVRSLGPDVSLAVDDAGAGSANFSHIVELRPAIVKIDAGLVRGVDRDHGRQALVVAMLHFAASTGCDVVAEGIETEPEREMLASLNVALGQGYLLGAPARIS